MDTPGRVDTLYRKKGRRYIPVGFDFTGFPADGYWLVADGRQSLLVPLAAPRPLEKLRYQKYRHRIAERISAAQRLGSLDGIVGDVLSELEEIVNQETVDAPDT